MPDVSVRLDADVSAYVSKMRAASAASDGLGKRIGASGKEVQAALNGMSKEAEQAAARQGRASAAAARQQSQAAAQAKASAAQTQASLSTLGSAATRVGLAGAAGLGLIGKAALDWESDWAGVTKTVNGTPPQMKALEASLRGLARELPSTHREIAGVAEAAGALGVKRQDVVSFTKTMVQLGTTTNLTADDAATSIAQLSNVMGTAGKDVGRLGSTLVALGNDGASTEKQILELGQRAAAAGSQIGLSEAEVLGFGSAITSTGMNVEAGGTAISKVFAKIDASVRKGGEGLDALAETSGMTTAQFRQAFETDAAGAITSFVEGLGRVKAEGGSVRDVLADMGVKGAYEVDTLGRLAGATKVAGAEQNLLRASLTTGREAWRQNTALAAEAAKRYETTSSKIAISWNKIKDSAITAGGALLPIAAKIAATVGSMAESFGRLPAPAQQAAVGILAVVTAAALVVGGTAKAIVGVAALKTAMVGLGAAGPRTAAALTALGKAGAVALGIGALAVAFGALDRKLGAQGGIAPKVEEATKQLLDLSNLPTVDINSKFKFDELDDLNGAINGNITGLNDALTRIGENNFGDRVGEQYDKLTGNVKSSTGQAKAMFAAYDQGFSALVSSGHTEQAGAAFKRLADEVRASGGSIEQLSAQFPGYRASVIAAAEANGNVVTSAEQVAQLMSGQLPAGFKAAQGGADATTASVGKVATEADKAAANLKSMTDALNENASAALAAAGSADGVQSALNAAGRARKTYVEAMVAEADAQGKSTKAAKRNAEAAYDSGKAYRGTSDASIALRESLRSVASASLANVQAMVNNGASAQDVSAANERARGAFLRTAASMNVGKSAAKAMADELFGVGKIHAKPKITAPSTQALKTARMTKAQFDQLPKEVRAKILALYNSGKVKEANAALNAINGKKATPRILTKSDAAKVSAAASRFLRSIKDGRPNVKTGSNAKTVTAAAKRFLASIKDVDPKVLTKKDLAAAQAAKRYLAGIKGSQPKVTTKADLSGARSAKNAVDSVKSKTVTIRTLRRDAGKGDTKSATGGLITHAGVLMRSRGGPVWGAGSATSDSIDAKLSNGEYVQRVKAVDYYGADVMRKLNNLQIPRERLQGFAAGGPVGRSAGGVDVPAIYRLIAATVAPLRDIAAATRTVATRQATATYEARRVAKPRAALDRADARDDAAKAARERLRLTNARQLDAARKRTADALAATRRGGTNDAERRALAAARAAQSRVSRQNTREMAEANARVTATTKAKTTATADYNKVAEKSKAATEALKTAQGELAEKQKAVADSARSVSDSFRQQYEGTITDARSWIDLMKTGAGDIAAFTERIATLRRAGLSETIVQQIIGMGAVAGNELASQIIGGGRGYVDQLNSTNKALQKAADALGYQAATGAGRYAAGGYLTGPGTGTSDSMRIDASTGEYVVNARATAANRATLDAMNYGRAVIDRNYVRGFASGGYVTRREPLVDTAALAAAVRHGMAGMRMSATINGDTVELLVDRALGGFVGQIGRGNA